MRSRSDGRFGCADSARPGRKVRAPQGRVLANGQEGRPYGKCHRNYTADPVSASCGHVMEARVKWCGKSAPAVGQPAGRVNPTRSKVK